MKTNRSILNIVIAAILFALIAPVMTYAQEEETFTTEAVRSKRTALKSKASQLEVLRKTLAAKQARLNQQAAALNQKGLTLAQKEAALNKLAQEQAQNNAAIKKNLEDLRKNLQEQKAIADAAEKKRLEEEERRLQEFKKEQEAFEKEQAMFHKEQAEAIAKLKGERGEFEKEKGEFEASKRMAPEVSFENKAIDRASKITNVTATISIAASLPDGTGSGLITEKDVAVGTPKKLVGPFIGAVGKQAMFGRQGSEYEITIKYKDDAAADKETKFKGVLNWNEPNEIIDDAKGNPAFELKFIYRVNDISVLLENYTLTP